MTVVLHVVVTKFEVAWFFVGEAGLRDGGWRLDVEAFHGVQETPHRAVIASEDG